MVSYLDARLHGGTWLVRIEDIDPPRAVEGASDSILKSLESHALNWDDQVRYQSQSHALHQAAVEQLTRAGKAYFCQCARRSLIANGHQHCYPGICRLLEHTSGALRVRVDKHRVSVPDRWQKPLSVNLEESPGDFIIVRRDRLIAYQLAVTVDDADQGVTDIVRGIDLYDSTPRQVFLQSVLNLPKPRYAHFPVVIGNDGAKLSKQTGAQPVDNSLAADNLCQVFKLLGMELDGPPSARTPAAWLRWAQQQYAADYFNDTTTLALRA